MINIHSKTLYDSQVMVTRPKAKDHLLMCDMETVGYIVKHDPKNKVGKTNRPLLVEFLDGRRSWWQPWELSFRQAKTIEANYNSNFYNPLFESQYTPSLIAKLIALNLSHAQTTLILNAALELLNQEHAHTDFNITHEEAMKMSSIISDILDATIWTEAEENKEQHERIT